MSSLEPDHVDATAADLPPPKKRSKKGKKAVNDDSSELITLPSVPSGSTDTPAATVDGEDAPAAPVFEAPTRRATDLLKLQLKKKEDKRARKAEKRALDVETGVVVEKPKAKRVRTKAPVQKMSYESVEPSYKAWRKTFAKALRRKSDTEPEAQESDAAAFLSLACPAGLPEGMPVSGPQAIVQARLVQSDLIGCKLTVTESKSNPSLLTKGGIVTAETHGTFKVVTAESVVRILPKKATVFSFTLPLDLATGRITKEAVEETTFVIYGDAFAFRSSDGVAIKWKPGSGPTGAELV